MSEMKKITEAQYLKAMKYKQWLEAELERATKITRAYVYQWEAERVSERKIKSITIKKGRLPSTAINKI